MRRRRSRLLALATVLIAVFVFAACAPAPPSSPAAADHVARHNYVRGLNGLSQLVHDGNLAANAQFHSDRLAAGAVNCANLWHSGELGSWYYGFSWGENVACVPGCPSDAERAFNLWLASPSHAANIFNGRYSLIGVGVACNGILQMVVTHFRS